MTENKRFVMYEHKGNDYILDTPNTSLDFIEMLGDALDSKEIVDRLNKQNMMIKSLEKQFQKQHGIIKEQDKRIIELENKLKGEWSNICFQFDENLRYKKTPLMSEKRFFLMRKFLRRDKFHDVICHRVMDSKETEKTLNRLYIKYSSLKIENEQLKQRVSELECLLELDKLHKEIEEGKTDKFVEVKLND